MEVAIQSGFPVCQEPLFHAVIQRFCFLQYGGSIILYCIGWQIIACGQIWPVAYFCGKKKILWEHSNGHEFTYDLCCYCITMVYLNSCNRDIMSCKA